MRKARASERYGSSCLDFDRYGRALENGKGRQPVPGVSLFEPRGRLPPNQENVELERAYVSSDGTAVCLELRFPYG